MVAGLWADRQSACVDPASGDAAPSSTSWRRAAARAPGSTTSPRATTTSPVRTTATTRAGPGYDLASGLGSPITAGGVACTEVLSVSPAQAPAGTVVTVNGLGLEARPSRSAGPRDGGVGTRDSAQVVVPAGSGTVACRPRARSANAAARAPSPTAPRAGCSPGSSVTTAIGTAIAASQASFPASGSANAVVLARSDFFSDALAGGPLAAAVGGPVLITESAERVLHLDPAVEAEIERVLVPGGTVYLLGGPRRSAPTSTPPCRASASRRDRLAGTDEYDTAIPSRSSWATRRPSSRRRASTSPTRCRRCPAAINHGAILLTDGTTQDPETAMYLAAHPTDTRYAIGGTARGRGRRPDGDGGLRPGPVRHLGRRRVDLLPEPSAVGCGHRANFPDALSAGPSLGRAKAPLLLVPPTGPLPPAVRGLPELAVGRSSPA
jgi:hypothetical protein